ncbi:hypothetical protein BG004_000587 [Podila humilis]|nr:hypothetical protein BG004_000587 [Podila humilis]
MVALTKTFLALALVVIGTAAQTTPAPAPAHTPKEMSQVVDCQAQCIGLPPAFGNKPDHTVQNFMRVPFHRRMLYLYRNMQPVVNPCLKNLRKFKGDYTKVTEDNFQSYVLCNSKTLTKNEEQYFSKSFNYKKNGFTKKEWTEFRNRTLPGFRRALHNCRGGCRRIHF